MDICGRNLPQTPTQQATWSLKIVLCVCMHMCTHTLEREQLLQSHNHLKKAAYSDCSLKKKIGLFNPGVYFTYHFHPPRSLRAVAAEINKKASRLLPALYRSTLFLNDEGTKLSSSCILKTFLKLTRPRRKSQQKGGKLGRTGASTGVDLTLTGSQICLAAQGRRRYSMLRGCSGKGFHRFQISLWN